MKPTLVLSALAAAVLAFAVGVPTAHAQLSTPEKKCFQGIGKAGKGYVKSTLKIKQKCREAGLKDGSCTTPDTAKLQKATDKLNASLGKSCPLNTFAFAEMGFPGPCADSNPGDGFTLSDLQICIKTSHETIVDQLMGIEYDSTLTSLNDTDLKCQKEVGKQGGKLVDCVLKVIQKCRNDIMNGKIVGILPDNCHEDDQKTKEAHDKCVTKAEASIIKKCLNSQTASLKVCEPDQTDSALAADCIHQTHDVRTDSPAIDVPPDLIDYEYAVRGGLCGDGIVNSLDEECDAPDDSACPGQCGTPQTPDGFFACLCKTKHRQRVVEHANADLDNGWSGRSHDSGIVEGGGYIADLYDCDGGGNCIVGPSCSLFPHSPCNVVAEAASGTTGDSVCAGLGQGTCRKERTAVGPHCFQNVQKKCNPKAAFDPTCGGAGDFCQKSFHGPPLPLSSGGVSVCVVNIFSEDVVGTTNLLTGTSAVRLRQNSVTHSSAGSANAPCPVCGGFCAGNRERCASTADCAVGQGPCVLALVCSNGPNIDLPCRVTPPFGGQSALFGSTSVDCPPFPGADISSKGLDILFNPATTGTTTKQPSVACDAPGFTNNTCFGGPNEGAACTTGSECPSGSCSPQCYCPNGGSTRQAPTDCENACLGGTNDAAPCADSSECPGGFCHVADCRVDVPDTASAQEGACTAGPFEGHCSVSSFQGCTINSDCQAPTCPFCQLGETCNITPRQCFVNTSGGVGILRAGTPGVIDRTTAALFCIPTTSSTSINNVAGIPGPGAITQPVTTIECPGGANCP